MVTYRTDRVNPLSAATLVVLALVSLLAIVPGQPAGAQSAGTDTVSSGNGDVPITRVVLNHGGVIDDQSASQSGVKDSFFFHYTDFRKLNTKKFPAKVWSSSKLTKLRG